MTSIDRLENGLTIIVEEVPHVESAAYELLIPGGIVSDSADSLGACLMLVELTSRGAGPYDSRALSEQFENLGIRHAEDADQERYSYRGSLLADNLSRALELVSLMVREPTLPKDEIDDIRSVLLQDIASLIDNPAQRAMVELSKRYYPEPYGRSALGTSEGLNASDHALLQRLWQTQFAPSAAVLSVAGRVRREEVLNIAQKFFGSWQGACQKLPVFGQLPKHSAHHIDYESAQLQIVMAYPSCKFEEPHYYDSKIAAGVLSGGMFGRLFIEVREKRGLCYSVNARHSSNQKFGTVTVYAGTTPERAHETLEVIISELRKLKGTVTQEELDRAKANLSSALIMSEESTGSRASSNASDWWISGRVRGLDQIQAEIDKVSIDSVNRYLDAYPPDSFMSLTLGSRKLDIESYYERAL